MKLNPAEAPLYGDCVLTVQLEENEACPSPQEEEEGEETMEFYLLFSGSSQRHLTSTIRISHVTLQAVCPGHNLCEQVVVVLCVARPNGAVITCSHENFTFVQDIALDTAHLLLKSTSHQVSLMNDPKKFKKLDVNLSLALKHLTQLQRLGPCSSAQPQIHSLREDLSRKQKDNYENVTQDQAHPEEHSTETKQRTVSNCISEHQQHSGLLHLEAAESLNRTGSFIPQNSGERDSLRSATNQGPSTDCEDASQDHQQQLQLFTHSDTVDLNEELHIDPDGRVFQHHSKLGTFTLTLSSLEKWELKPGTDCCLQDDVAQLRKRIQQHKDKKGKLAHYGTIIATTACSTICYNPVNPTSSVVGNKGGNGSTKLAQDCLVQGNSQLENTAAGTAGSVSQEQETGGTQVARTGCTRRNKKRTAKSTRAETESPGSPPVVTKGSAWDTVPETKALSFVEQARENTFTANEPQKDLPQIHISVEGDDQNSRTIVSPATTTVEKQEEVKSEVEQIILDQVTQIVKELGHIEDFQTKDCIVISRQEAAPERKGLFTETMGQDQSQHNSEKAISPEAGKGIHPQKDLDGSTTVLEGAAWYQGENNDSREETKSQSVWYDSEQLEQDISSENAISIPQLSELCVSSCQLSLTLSQPHATGLKPTVSHGSASQRQEVHGSQRDEEAGPDWEKASREEVSAHSKKSSENEEEDDKQGHGDKGAKSRRKKRKKRGKRGGIERKQLSSTSSVESQSQTEILIQVTDQNIQSTDITGRADIPAPSASVPGNTEKDTMLLPNQAGEPRDGTNFNFSTLESDLTELSGTTDFNLLGEPSEDKNTFHEITELIQDTTAAHSEEMDIQMTENVETSALQRKKREFFDCKDNIASVNKDYIVQVLQDENPSTEILVNDPDLSQLNLHSQKTVLVQFVDKPLQLGHPSRNSPEISEPADAFDSPIHGTTDVPPPQTWEGSSEIVAEGLSGHCLASEMLGDQALKGENKNELWKKEEAKIGSLQRREEVEQGSNNVARVEEGPLIENELELAATAVAVVNVAIASAMAKLEISQKFAESCTKAPAGINPLSQEKTDEPPAPFNQVNDSVNTGPLTQYVNKDQPYGESQKAETANSEQQHDELNIDSAQETESKQPGGTSQAFMQLCSDEETDNDLPVKKDSSGLHQTVDLQTTTSTDKQQDSINQMSFVLSSNEQNKPNLAAEEDSFDILENKCDGLLSNETNDETSVVLQITNEVFDKTPDPCPVLDTGQECLHTLVPEEPVLEEIEAEIIVEGLPANDEVDVGCLLLERSMSKERSDTSLSQSDSTGEQALALSCDLVSHPNTHDQCPEDDALVELETGDQPSQQNVPDTEEAVVMELKDDALESLDQDGDVVNGWRERERLMNNSEEQADSAEAGIHSGQREEPASKRSAVDCLHALQIQRETDVFYSAQHCPDPNTQTAIPAGSKKSPLVCLQEEDDVSPKPNSEVEDTVLKESEDRSSCTEKSDQKVRVSWSSTDDASSVLGTFSEEHSISTSDPNNSRLSWKSEADDTGLGEMEGGDDEDKKDKPSANLVSSAILRASQRSLSPSQRHSWEPGRNDAPTDIDIGPCSSLKSLSEDVRPSKTPLHRRSMSWCPANLPLPDPKQMDNRSYSLEGLGEVDLTPGQCSGLSEQGDPERGQNNDCFTEDEQKTHQVLSVTNSCPGIFSHQTHTKSVSMLTVSHPGSDACGCPRSKRRISFSISISPLLSKNRRFFSMSSFSSDEEEMGGSTSLFPCNSVFLENSISEEEPGPLRSSTEAKGGPKISRTFSYLRNKMSKKGKEKEKDKKGEKDRESKERDKKTSNGHVFVSVCPPVSSCCRQCNKLLQTKECLHCSNCGVHVHKNCKDSVAVCSKNRNKLQVMAPEAVPPATTTRTKSTSSTGSTVSSLSSSSRERWSTATTPEDQFPLAFPKRTPSIFTTHGNLSKSISISNIAGLDDVTLKGLKFRSQSTDSLNKSQVNASTESLTDEGTEMMDTQIMGEFECDIKDLEADSWSSTVDKKFLKTLKKDEIKRQDVIYELYQTEFHHVRTLRIMSEVYYKGIQKELQLDTHTLEKIFPVLDDLVETHTEFLHQLLEQKRGSSVEGQHRSFLIYSIGDTLVKQFSGSRAERMKKVYGKFCSRHNEAVNHYKDLLGKDKRFQTLIKKVMSSSVVRRLSIPECILLVTQRITKYPVLIQRILQHTKETDTEHNCVSEALRLVKEIITAVDCKVNEQEKKRRLKEVYSRTDSKSIMRMKSGQMFAKEDLVRGRRLLHDGALQLKNSAGRLKEVHSLLLSDVLVFLQEKDQKYVFASLDQRSTVISLQNLIVREVANEERGLFLITAGIEKPEMVEVLASSKEERNTWRAIIQDAMHCMDKDEDEGIPSETEEDRRLQESRAKEIRELLRAKDEQIISLLEEKVHIFRQLSDCNTVVYDACPAVRDRMLFRATPDDVTKGEPIICEALREVESLHSLVNTGLGGAACSVSIGPVGGGVGPVCLPRRAETFGGFDSHQMNISKNGEKEEADESVDLRRTESDGVLKKGATASLQLLLKRNNEQVQSSVTHLHDLLLSLQAVVVQQDSFIEDQRQAINERLTANSSRHSSSSSLSSTSSSRPSSLIEQEKHRSLERQRQEAASLQKQQVAHQEEKRRREREWDVKDKVLSEREEKLKEEEECAEKRHQELQEERELLQRNRDCYQKEVERLREAQAKLEWDKEALRRDTERLEAQRREQAEQLQRYSRTPSITSEDSIRFPSTSSLDLDSKEAAEQPKEVELSSSAPTKEPFLRIGSKRMGKNFNPFSSSSSKAQGAEKEPSRLLQLTKPKKDKKEKKKKGREAPPTGAQTVVMSDFQNDDENFSC